MTGLNSAYNLRKDYFLAEKENKATASIEAEGMSSCFASLVRTVSLAKHDILGQTSRVVTL